MSNYVRPLAAATTKGLLAGLVFPVAFCVAVVVRDAWEGVSAAQQIQVLELVAPFGISGFLTSLLTSLAMLLTSPKAGEAVAPWRISSLGWVALNAVAVPLIVLVLFFHAFGGKGGWLFVLLVGNTWVAGWVSGESTKLSRQEKGPS
jgi:hypothetical protein